MPLVLDDDAIRLTGSCPIETAEPLLDALRGAAAPRIDVSGLDHAHTAVLQVLIAARPILEGRPVDPVTAACLAGLPRDPA
ncbi:STAS domain-containing protein [Methylobacterium sp. ID0610]|uniref:STAS domain-containing protein n=1 Tax=Methylobacterium carpenticola TaxID=3344827 RepID=UPI0036C5A366